MPDDQRSFKVFGVVEIQGTSAPEDLDPWPGGLLQQYPIALDLGRRMLAGMPATEGSLEPQTSRPQAGLLLTRLSLALDRRDGRQ